MTPKEEAASKQLKDKNSKMACLREDMEKNCLNCFISEMETRGITPITMRDKGVVVDQVLEEICADKKTTCNCNNRVYFEENPELKRPHLSNLHAMYRIQQMCN